MVKRITRSSQLPVPGTPVRVEPVSACSAYSCGDHGLETDADDVCPICMEVIVETSEQARPEIIMPE